MRQRRGKKGENREAGQATIEFALMILLLMAFILFFVQLSLVFAWGNFVHYATFMSARAYLAAGPSREEQQERAKDVIVRFVKRGPGLAGVDRFPSIAKGTGGGDPSGFRIEFSEGDRNSSWMNGVRYTFKSRIFLLPLGGAGGGKAGSNVNSLTLTSESWLGRDPAYDECVNEMGRLKGYWDNGC